MSRARALLRNLFRRGQVRREVQDEVDAAFELLVLEHERAGLDPAAARRAATLAFGRVDRVAENVHDVKAGAVFGAWSQDLRQAVRLLRRGPVFTAFAIASLALGIGAVGAIFQLFDTIVVRKIAVPEPGQLVVASFGGPNGRFNYSLPYPHFDEIRRTSTTLDGIFATNPFGRVSVSHQGQTDIVEGIYVSGGYYPTLRVAPAAGRLLEAGDDKPGADVAVLSHRYWQRRFGGRPDVVGSAVTLNGLSFTIVGVEAASFTGTEVGRPYDISVPMRARDRLDQGGPLWTEAFATWIYVMGRMKPGVTLPEAESELRTIFARVSTTAAATPVQERLARENQLRLESGARGSASDLRLGYERWLRLVMTMLGAVLLLASLNVATLLLSRADARRREIATRVALGAGRWRIVRQLVTETMVLAGVAGLLGAALAGWGARILLALVTPAHDTLPIELASGPRLAVFTLSVSLVVCLIAGLIPSLRATSAVRLAGSRQVGGGRSRRLLDRTLVGAQVALSLVLLVTAGLFGRTLANLWGQDPGYTRDNVLMFSVDARLAGRTGEAIAASYRAVFDALREIPGAGQVTVSAVRPVSDNRYFVSSATELGDRILSQDTRIRFAFNNVGPGYFSTFGIRIVAGRDFDARDRQDAPKVAIISERMARHFEGSALGQRLGRGPNGREIVGIVSDVRYANVRDVPREVVYFPLFQQTGRQMDVPTFEIRHAGPVAGVLAQARDAVTRVDPALTMFRVRTLEQQTEDSFARERLLALLASYFGGFAVLLACIGLYGLMSYAVTQRTPEIGLRMALGAPAWSVTWLTVRDNVWTVALGAAAGLGAAAAVVRLVQSQLFGVEPRDPVVFAGAAGVLLLMAAAAAFVPARRAARIDPLVALRHE